MFDIHLMVSRHSMFYGPFTALLCRWDWIVSNIASRLKAAYCASRTWLNTTNSEMSDKVLSRFLNRYIRLALRDVFSANKIITKNCQKQLNYQILIG